MSRSNERLNRTSSSGGVITVSRRAASSMAKGRPSTRSAISMSDGSAGVHRRPRSPGPLDEKSDPGVLGRWGIVSRGSAERMDSLDMLAIDVQMRVGL